MNHRDSDLPSYCQDTSLEEAYVERVLLPAIPRMAYAVAGAIMDARTATRVVAPLERATFVEKIRDRLATTPDAALEEIGVEFDLLPSFETWAFRLRDR